MDVLDDPSIREFMVLDNVCQSIVVYFVNNTQHIANSNPSNNLCSPEFHSTNHYVHTQNCGHLWHLKLLATQWVVCPNSLFRLKAKKTSTWSKLLLALCEGNPPVVPSQRASIASLSISWCLHNVLVASRTWWWTKKYSTSWQHKFADKKIGACHHVSYICNNLSFVNCTTPTWTFLSG